MTAELWHFRGREARGLGLPRECPDGRLAPESRAAWCAGWDEEERLRRQPTPEERAEASRVVKNLKAWAAENLGGAKR